ncbi:MAG: TatD family hydrolase [Lachnospiraceae bacterium]|nr:TatD family hydrolase [Lachnospiraceae bacterium]
MYDAHVHYHDKAFDRDREEILKAVKAAGIDLVCEAGEDIEGSLAAVRMAERYGGAGYPEIKVSVGLHPLYMEAAGADWQERLKELLKCPAVTAIGECGLDYRGIKDEGIRQRQREVFEAQLRLCEEYGLPAVVHSVDAAADTLKILKAHSKVSGLLHGFAYSAEMAEQFAALGWKIGINALVLRPGAKKIKEVAAVVPAASVRLETDAPYMPLIKGSRNDSRNIPAIIEAVNSIRKEAGAEPICQEQASL